ncbi:MAG: tetratricopeptide repeat protein [Sulfuritalea sp.]|nr:tetratricopeptide repeat protein [Sulfuritalea sp.]
MPATYARLLLVLPGWLAFMLYLPALTHGFVWDDNYFLTLLPNLRDPELWLQQLFEPLFVSRNYFRPLPLFSFVVEARLGGLDPFVFHLTNLMFHAANTTLVVLLARAAIPAGGMAAAGAGLLFAVHPALVENVAWISDRFDLMMLFFVLLALVCEHHLARPLVRAVVVGLLFLLALLCKEPAVVLLALLPLWQALRYTATPGWRQALRASRAHGDATVWGALLLALLCYLAIRYAAIGLLHQDDSATGKGSGLQHLLLVGKSFGWYAVLALWPFGQTLPVHPAPTPVALGDTWAWLGLLAGVAVCAALVYSLVCRPQARRTALAGAMVLAALAPVSNLVQLTIADNLVHDRFLMLPIAFLALLLAMVWEAHGRRIVPAVVAGAWSLVAAISVSNTVPHWESNLSLWRWAYAQEPTSEIAGQNYVAALTDAGHDKEVVAVARVLLANGPEVASTAENLALALARQGHYDEAERLARRAIELYGSRQGVANGRHDLGNAYNSLGSIYLRQSRRDEAEQALRRAISLTPYYSQAHFNLATLLYERGDWDGGDKSLALAVRYSTPAMAAVRQSLGNEKKTQMQAKSG